MKRRIRRPRLVERDIAEHAEYISRSNLAAATRFVNKVEETLLELAEGPGMGSLWEPPKPQNAEYRLWPVKDFRNYIVVYRELPDGIAVVRVLHGSRDFDSIL